MSSLINRIRERRARLATERAQRGAELLDQARLNWAGKVNPDTLRMASYKNCVLGQIYGGFGKGFDALPLNGHSTHYGFFSFFLNKPLKKAWRAEIQRRHAPIAI